MRLSIKILLLPLLLFIPSLVMAQQDAPRPDEDDEEERYIRENPVIEYDDEIDIEIPAFVSKEKNHINLNGADWSRLRRAINNSPRSTASIVLIGDSHVQADINTATARDLLQFDYGDAGRGLITPLKMSGTNQPFDYTFSSNGGWSATKFMRIPWKGPMGFTGSAITTSSRNSSLTFSTSSRDDYNPFSSVLIFHKGKMSVTSVTGENGQPLQFQTIPSKDYTQVIFFTPQTRITVHFTTEGTLTVYGASLSGDRPGVFLHAIGNNGATYDHYNRIGDMGKGLQPLNPDLVIISLGCNEAFGHLNTDAFYRSIDKLVTNIRDANPRAQILLTTPIECRRHGGGVNQNILPLRNTILRYGEENGIPTYDWYDIAGGAGALNTWSANGLYAGDRIHHTAKGYRLQGRMLYEALIEQFNKQ